MKRLIILLSIALSACSTTRVASVKQPWPEAPEELRAVCADLQKVPESTEKLSDVLNIVTDNYALYKECKVKTDNWIKWYDTQKQIYESVK